VVLLVISTTIGGRTALGGAGATFTVNSTGNGQDADVFDPVCETATGNATCTLRAAIEQANATADQDTIAFNIPTSDPGFSGYGTYEIRPLSPLPVIGNPVVIDGTTQPEFLAQPVSLRRPVILLCGISAGALVDGLRITSGSSTVRGLVISRFGISAGSNGIEIQGPSGNNRIEGNFIGVNAAGAGPPGDPAPCWEPNGPQVTGTELDPEWGNSGSGIFINGSPNNVIGGTGGLTPGVDCTGTCNIIGFGGHGDSALSDAHGVEIAGTGATGNTVLGNWIGLNPAGGPEWGDFCQDAVDSDGDNAINDGCPQVGAMAESGVQCGINNLNSDSPDDTLVNDGCPTVIGNVKDFGNEGDGVRIFGVANNTIGSSGAGEGNVITANDSDGIEIEGGAETGSSCIGNADNDGDAAVNDGCPQAGTTAEAGAQCANNTNDDAPDDTLINDGCPGVKVASGNHLEGNYIGTISDGAAVPLVSKQFYGVLIDSAPSNTIGGTTGTTAGGPCTGACNVVSGNLTGVQLQGGGATGNMMQGTYVGTDVTGTTDLGNISSGVMIATGASTNTIGGTAPGARNVISGNNLHGIEINSGTSAGNQVLGNYVGINAAGTVELYNGQPGAPTTGRGVRINGAPGNTVGAPAGGGNLISGNVRYGVEVIGLTAADNIVQSNYIGTDAAGASPVGNWEAGVVVSGAPDTVIGGLGAGARNVISGNGQGSQLFVAQGVWVLGSAASGTLVQGNLIGTDAAGTAALSNLGIGVLIVGAPNNTVGGSGNSARNVISGNGIHGVELDGVGATGNVVKGNYIGLNVDGDAGLNNGGDGVLISDAAGNAVGAAGAGNVISSNGSMGVELLGIASSGNLVQANFIGTDLTGATDLGNAQHGVFINGAPDNTIGGTSTGIRNVISGNGTGVFIQNSGASGNSIIGNFIGTNATGVADVGNTFDGVRLGGDASDNVVGGPTPADANVIAYNGGDGVDLDPTAGVGNRIQRSTIFANGGLGIDLFPDGVTANDAGDGDVGPNDLQNNPDLTSANSTLSGTTIVGSLNSTPSTSFSIYFFSDTGCDPSGSGEGRTFIGSTNVTTDGSGNVGFNVLVSGVALAGEVVNATATDPGGSTSEFSECQVATGVSQQPGVKQGDVNCDNSVNSIDSLLILRHVAGLSVNQNQPCPGIGTVLTLAGVFGDVDCTGVVNSIDALKVLRAAAGLSVQQNEPPPCTDIGQPLP
jgi:hypothetical protein